MKKQTKAQKVLAYYGKNPTASTKEIAAKVGTATAYAYAVIKSNTNPTDEFVVDLETGEVERREKSDGSTASYYQLPKGAAELQDLISHKDMNAQIGEIFRACYRYGEVAHSKMLRDAKKIKFYAEAEIKRLEELQ
jgi:hypothetical protein